MTDQAQPIDEASPSATVAAPESDDLESLLRQFEAETAAPAAKAAEQPPPNSPSEIARAVEHREQPQQFQWPSASASDHQVLRDQVGTLTRHIDRLNAEFAQRKFEGAREELLKRLGDATDDAQLPQDYTRSWLDMRALQDQELLNAFLGQFDGEQGAANWKSHEKRLTSQLRKAVSEFERSRIDPAATEDREAVTAAVRGAAKQPPPERPPNLDRMSNAELRKHTEDKFGYTPNI